ncbi:glycoside hydrolase family 43 protein [Geofilum rubicundum]|uniref:glycoside hydrolase family 43 protein n=1 Tax=Geofilum rubicundum TaxID=472113 RepID=UPI0007850FA7|nr:glycoside hydrolase family 43 protein [Geofilum rubicundum]
MKVKQTWRLLAFLLVASSWVAGCSQPAEEIKFNNPLALQRADPWVHKAEDGTYYLIATAPEYDRIEIRKANTINGLATAEAKVIWRKHESGPMGNHIWAPELHRIDGKWYIHFAAAPAEDRWKIRMHVLSSESDDPTTGEWVEEGQIQTQRDDFALDATTFEVEGERYLIWAERAQPHNTGLIIAKMKDPITLEGPEVVITEPEYEWEKHKYQVNEGAAVLKRNGKVFVSFSASATDANYAIGLLWAEIGDDLLDPASWNKLPEPVFYSNEEFNRYGPGHNSFTVAEDGKTDVMIYHARDYKEIEGESLYDPNRHTRARVLHWTEDGMPDFRQGIDD